MKFSHGIIAIALFFFVVASQAMQEQNPCFSTSPTTAPFTALEVLEHARTAPEIYDMVYLESDEGQTAIEAILLLVKETGFLPKEHATNSAWNRGRPSAGYNKSLIASYVCREYKEQTR